jgi:RND family efflux transporter MFP subunit
MGLALSGCGHEAPPPPHPGRASEAVRIATVATQDIPVYEEIVGTVQPRHQASVSAKIAGRIIRALADPGARVEKDQLLAELEVRELESALEGARAALENAQREQDRYRTALAGGGISKSEIDRVESAFRVAQAGYEEIARRIEYAAIKAPFDGVITRKYMEAGELALPGEAIYRIEDPTNLRLEIDVAESIAGDIRLGRKLGVRVDGANAVLEGTVSEAAPSADVGSRTLLVKLD